MRLSPAGRRLAAVTVAAVAVIGGVTCRDNAAGPVLFPRAMLSVVPVMPGDGSGPMNAVLGINNYRVVIRESGHVLKDTILTFNPGSDSLVVNLLVGVSHPGGMVDVTFEARSGSTVLFTGTAPVATQSAQGAAVAARLDTVHVNYIGPGSSIGTLTIQPRDTSALFGDTVPFRAVATDSAAGVVSNFYVIWAARDTSAKVNTVGRLRTPVHRGFTWVVGRTPSGIKDSTRLFFVPVPASMKRVLGDSQVANAGAALASPIGVRLLAADSSPVAGVPVRFRALTGGSVVDTIKLTDTTGLATTLVTLGAVAGSQSFEAKSGAFTLNFGATATVGAASTIAVNGGNGQTGTVGALVAVSPSAIVKDALGNPVPGVKVYWTTAPNNGAPVNDSSLTNVAGVATSGGWRLGATLKADTLVATAGALTTRFTATAVVGPPSVVAIISGDNQSAIGGNVLPAALVVEVRDSLANPLTGVTVAWATTDGTIAPPTSVTNAAGRTQANWTMPVATGPKVATATVTGVTPTQFHATSNPLTPTLTLQVIGSNVVGEGRTGSVLIKTTTPVPAGPPLSVAVVSSNTSNLTVAASPVTIPGGDSVTIATVNGILHIAAVTLTASATGYTTGILTFPVSLNLISSSVTLNVGLGQTASLPVTLTSVAPAGGVAVSVVSSTPANVFVTTPTVTVPAGSASATATVRGDALGSSTVVLSNANYAPFTSTVSVTASLLFSSASLTIYDQLPAQPATVTLRSGASPIAAPSPGVTVTLTSNNPTCVANGSISIPTGLTSGTVNIPYAGSATLPCTAKLAATSVAGVTPDTLTVSVQPQPKLSVSQATVGRGLQVLMGGFILPVAQHGGTTLTFTSADSSKVLLSFADSLVGSGSITASLPNGSTFLNFYVNALEGSGPNDTVRVFATASGGFKPDTGFVLRRTTSYDISGVVGTTTTFTLRGLITARVGYLNTPAATVLTGVQPLRPGAATRTVTFGTSAVGVAGLRGGTGTDTTTVKDTLTATIAARASQTSTSFAANGVAVQPVGVGTASIGVRISDPNMPVITNANATINVTAPALPLPSLSIGRGLQTSTSSAFLGAPAPPGGVLVSVLNPAPTKLKLATNDSTPGTDSIGVFVPAGSTFFSYYVQALDGTGADTTINLSGTAPGYAPSTGGVIQLRNSAFQIISLPATTTTLTAPSFFQVRVGYLNTASSTTLAGIEAIRAGGAPLTLNVVNTTPGSATLLSQADSTTGLDSINVQIQPRQTSTAFSLATGGMSLKPIAAGTTIIRVRTALGSAPFGLTTNSSDTVTISAPVVTPAGTTVGRGLQLLVSSFGGLSAPAPAGGLTVTLTSADPSKVRLALNDSTPGTTSVNIPMTAGATTFSYYVQAMEGAGANDTTFITASAPAFTSANATIQLRTMGFDISGLPAATTTLSTRSNFTVRVGYLNLPTATFLTSVQNIRAGGVPRLFQIVTTTGTIGKLLSAADSTTGVDSLELTIPVRQSVSPGSLATGGVALRPIVAGTFIVHANVPTGPITPGKNVDTVTITAPSISMPGTITVGAGLQSFVSSASSLSVPAPAGGVVVKLATSDPSRVRLATNDSTPGVDTITVTVGPGASVFSYYVQGMEGTTGTVLLTAIAAGYTNGTASLNVVAPAVELVSVSTALETFERGSITARIGVPNASGPPPTALTLVQAVRAGAPGPLAVTLTSSVPGVVSILTRTDSVAGSGTQNLQIPVRSNSTTGTLSLANSAQLKAQTPGTSVVSANIAGYIQTTSAIGTTVNVTTPTIITATTNVGSGLQLQVFANLSASFHGGKTVTITSTDPSRLVLSPDGIVAGTTSITVNVADKTTAFNFFIQGIEGQTGSVNITLAAPGFATTTIAHNVVQPMVEITSLTTSISTTAPDQNFQVRVGVANNQTTPTFLASIQAVRAGAPSALAVTVTGSPGAPPRIVSLGAAAASQNANIAIGSSNTPATPALGGFAFRPNGGTGTVTVSVTAPGYLVTPATSTRTVNVIP